MSTLAAILQKDPPELAADIPQDLRKLIARCLTQQRHKTSGSTALEWKKSSSRS
jgi:hypothetical protein